SSKSSISTPVDPELVLVCVESKFYNFQFYAQFCLPPPTGGYVSIYLKNYPKLASGEMACDDASYWL
ncbi:hypothetical protein L195_g060070, partial [Trifolium pratense]